MKKLSGVENWFTCGSSSFPKLGNWAWCLLDLVTQTDSHGLLILCQGHQDHPVEDWHVNRGSVAPSGLELLSHPAWLWPSRLTHLSDDVITYIHRRRQTSGEPAGTFRSRPSLPLQCHIPTPLLVSLTHTMHFHVYVFGHVVPTPPRCTSPFCQSCWDVSIHIRRLLPLGWVPQWINPLTPPSYPVCASYSPLTGLHCSMEWCFHQLCEVFFMATPQPAPAPAFSPFPRSTLRQVGRQPNLWVTQSPPKPPSPVLPWPAQASQTTVAECSCPAHIPEEAEDSILVMAQCSQSRPIKDNHFQHVRPSPPAKPFHLSHISVLLLKMYIKPQELVHQK